MNLEVNSMYAHLVIVPWDSCRGEEHKLQWDGVHSTLWSWGVQVVLAADQRRWYSRVATAAVYRPKEMVHTAELWGLQSRLKGSSSKIATLGSHLLPPRHKPSCEQKWAAALLHLSLPSQQISSWKTAFLDILTSVDLLQFIPPVNWKPFNYSAR